MPYSRRSNSAFRGNVMLLLSFIRIVGMFTSIFNGIVGLWICLETRHDMLHARYDLLKSLAIIGSNSVSI